jgi:hypothetical protein
MALVGMLALASPGVRVARAGDGDAPSSGIPPRILSDDAGSCPDKTAAWVHRPSVSAYIAQQLKAEMQKSGEKPVVLNGRGYNYRVMRDPQRELAIIEAEAKRQQDQPPASR